MFKGKKILTVVPARGGSKGIRLKNIQSILGIPLVALVGALVQKIPIIDRAVVSTDHPKIAQIAREAGLDVPFFRPPMLSGDRIADWDVLNHALLEMEKIDNTLYDVVVMLQPTSPLRKEKHVINTIEKLVNENWDSVWTVSVTDSKNHPLKQLKINCGQLEFYDKQGKTIIARQQLDTLYHRNGAAYAMTRNCIINAKNIYGKKTGCVVLEEEMISIDTTWDLKLIEFIFREKKSKMTKKNKNF
jgi:CMP-N-acetylneuraminic acid synthetase